MQAGQKVLLEPLIGYKQVTLFFHPITKRLYKNKAMRAPCAAGVESGKKKKNMPAGHMVLLEPHWLQIRRNFFSSNHQQFD